VRAVLPDDRGLIERLTGFDNFAVDAVELVNGMTSLRAAGRIDRGHEPAQLLAALAVEWATFLAPLQIAAVEKFGRVEGLPVAEVVRAMPAFPQEAAAEHRKPPFIEAGEAERFLNLDKGIDGLGTAGVLADASPTGRGSAAGIGFVAEGGAMSDQKNQKETLYQVWWKQIQNRPSLAAISLAGALIISLGSFTDALTKISGLFRSTPAPVGGAEILIKQAHVIPNPAPLLGRAGSLPINYAVEVVVHNQGSDPARDCSAQVETPLTTYQSIYPDKQVGDGGIPPKSQRLLYFGFEDTGLRNVQNGKLLVKCGDAVTDFLPLKSE
jgi:hypothetical protein